MLNGTSRRALLALLAALAVLGIVAGPASAKTKTATKTVCVPGFAIPQGAHTASLLPLSLGKLPRKARILDVDAGLRITTADAGDQHFYLASPGGKLALLADYPTAATGSDFGTGPGCGGSPTVWDDEAPGADLTGSVTPRAGTFKPFTALSALDGGLAAGNFSFVFTDVDHDASTAATVNGASITVTYRYPVRKKKPKKSGAASAKAKFVNRTATKDVCANFAMAIDNGPGDSRSTVTPAAIATGKLPKGAKITDVDARVRMTHTHAGDVAFFLASPSGGIVPLAVGDNENVPEPDVAGAPFGSGATNCTGTPLGFDDEATLFAATGLEGPGPNFTGTFKPNLPLAAFDGRQAAGTWTLYVIDHNTGDFGTFHAAGLNIDYRYRAKKK